MAVSDGGFVDAEPRGYGRQRWPVSAFAGEEQIVDLAIVICAAAERGANFGRDREVGEDLLDGAIEDGVGDREQAHEEEIGTLD